MSFEFPWLFLLLPPLWYCLYRCRERLSPRYFVHLELFAVRRGWFKWLWLLRYLVVLLVVTAIASPVTIDKDDPLNRQGVDVVLALDASGSMGASGFDPQSRESRFDIARKIAKHFIVDRIGDNAGVVIFGDFAFIASPVTYEKTVVAEMMDYLVYGMAGQNTAIGEGIAMGVRALEDSQAISKVLILLTDGEHNSGRVSPKEATALAVKHGIRIYTVGMGRDGEFDEAMLRRIADESGGAFFAAYDPEALAAVYDAIDGLERSRIKSERFLRKEYYYAWPLGAGIFLLFYLWRREALL
ncbi:VWA domain-containing protein [Sulfurimonas sp. ST-25]|uniref:VWA domain-containing protein n=1 Tax=Sulfurimonas sp. ST-25 TaxID=3400151 RepID=UPI003A86F276